VRTTETMIMTRLRALSPEFLRYEGPPRAQGVGYHQRVGRSIGGGDRRQMAANLDGLEAGPADQEAAHVLTREELGRVAEVTLPP
jgi:hypothetical protein